MSEGSIDFATSSLALDAEDESISVSTTVMNGFSTDNLDDDDDFNTFQPRSAPILVRVIGFLLELPARIFDGIRWLIWRSGIHRMFHMLVGGLIYLQHLVLISFGFCLHALLQATVFSKVSETVWNVLAKGFHFLGDTSDAMILKIVQLGERLPIFGYLLVPIRIFFEAMYIIRCFSMDWLGTRRFKLLVGAIPATALALGIGYFLFRLPFYPAQAKAKHYRMAIHEALANKDYERVDLFNRKLSQLNQATNERLAFQSAIQLAEDKRHADAIKLMQSIATPEEQGFAPAHFWLARMMLSEPEKFDTSETERLAIIEKHLQHSVALYPTWVEPALLLASHFANTGQIQESRRVLEAKIPERLSTTHRADVANLYLQIGDVEKAREDAASVARSFRLRHKDHGGSSQKLTRTEYLAWATAEDISGNFAGVTEVLHDALTAYPDDEDVRKNFVDTGINRYDQLMSSGPPYTTIDARIELLNELLVIAPNNNELMFRVANLKVGAPNNPSATRLVAIAERSSSPLAITRFAEIEFGKGNIAKARQYFERVLTLDNDNANALNNLAWLSAHSPPIDLDKAIAYANRAVELAPRNPHFRDTRGHVLVRIGRWDDAVSDLSIAANGLPGNVGTLTAIADAYKGLGNQELEKAYRESAGQIK